MLTDIPSLLPLPDPSAFLPSDNGYGRFYPKGMPAALGLPHIALLHSTAAGPPAHVLLPLRAGTCTLKKQDLAPGAQPSVFAQGSVVQWASGYLSA